MKNFINESTNNIRLDTLIGEATIPMIISISRKHSFGAQWSDRILTTVKDKYKERIIIHTFYLEDSVRIVSMLGEEKSMITYFIKEKEIKASLSGSVAKSIFQKNLSSIIS